jgi:hypothetical protein
MAWFPQVVFYLGIFDAGLTMLGGMLTAFIFLMGWDAERLWQRVLPAGGAIIISTFAAAAILGVTRWLGGQP